MTRLRRAALLAGWLAAGLLAWAPTHAQEPSSTLKKVEKDLAGAKKKEAELAAQAEKTASELASLRARMIDVAAEVRARETELNELEATLAALEAQEAEHMSELGADQVRLGQLLGMLERLSRVPSEALVVRPESPTDLVRSALLLRAAVPSLRARAESLADELHQLDALRTEIAIKRTQAGAERAKLATEERKLAALLAEREKHHKQTEAERRKLADRMAALSSQAKDIKDLMARIEADRKREAQAQAAAEAARKADEARIAALRAPSAKGDAPKGALLPVTGQIRLRYGQLDDVGATARGLTIATRPGSTIVAPMAGTVMFAGPFKGYGQIVILEHRDGLHSLIAGVSRIDASVGQQVAGGEPIGRAGDGGKGEPTVYFELRKNGQPINPQLGL